MPEKKKPVKKKKTTKKVVKKSVKKKPIKKSPVVDVEKDMQEIKFSEKEVSSQNVETPPEEKKTFPEVEDLVKQAWHKPEIQEIPDVGGTPAGTSAKATVPKKASAPEGDSADDDFTSVDTFAGTSADTYANATVPKKASVSKKASVTEEDSADEDHMMDMLGDHFDDESAYADTYAGTSAKATVPKKASVSKKATVSEDATVHDESAYADTYAGTSANATVPKKASVSKEATADEDEKDLDDQLSEIYKDKDGSIPNMRDFETRKNHRFFRALFTFFFSCLFLGAVAWFGFIVYSGPSGFNEEDIILSISGEETVQIGQSVRYRVRYVNADDTSLSQTRLEVRYPDGFVFERSSQDPDNDANNEWILGALGPGESGFIDIYGWMYGDKGERQSLRAFFTYTPENFSSAFQKVATVAVHTEKSPVRLDIDAPKEVVVGEISEFTINVVFETTTQVDTNNLAIEIDPGDIFLKKESSQDPDEFYPYRWTIDQANQSSSVIIRGSFLVEDTVEEVRLPIRIIGKGHASDIDTYIYEETELVAGVLFNDIRLNAAMNGATSELTLQPGDVMNTTIFVKNNGDTAMKNVRVRAIFDGPSFEEKSLFAWDRLTDFATGTIEGEQLSSSTRQGRIIWTSEEIDSLAEISPGLDTRINLSLPIRNHEEILLSDFDTYEGQFVAEIQYETAEGIEILSSIPISFIINSDTKLEVQAQTPDEQNVEDYSVSWIITNHFHPLENIRLQAEIFGDTTLVTSSVPAGTFTKNDENIVEWVMDEMPIEIDILPLQFELKRNTLNPSQSQLMSKVEMRAVDTVTGEEIILIGNEIGL